MWFSCNCFFIFCLEQTRKFIFPYQSPPECHAHQVKAMHQTATMEVTRVFFFLLHLNSPRKTSIFQRIQLKWKQFFLWIENSLKKSVTGRQTLFLNPAHSWWEFSTKQTNWTKQKQKRQEGFWNSAYFIVKFSESILFPKMLKCCISTYSKKMFSLWNFFFYFKPP